ncbi:MAG: hypothetical protein Kow0031_21230 [Anaerolineae bacterium]
MPDSSDFNINAATSLSGKTIGKYQLHESLGSGGMASVYRASQMPLGRTVAVKVLHPHLTQQESFRSRFLREAKAVASLRHPHIVQMYDYDFQDGVCYMALEFLDGGSLEEQLAALATQSRGPVPLPPQEALPIIRQMAGALDFAHKQRVIHRDIKPANMMRTSDGRTVLTDFGIATVLHETRLTVDGGTSGTPSYMSPEQALGERGDERSDIYSLGAVLYELVTGRLPFEADTLYGLIMMHVNEPPPPASQVNPDVPPVVEQIIQKAMAKNPDDRYQTAADLEAVEAGRAVEIVLPQAGSNRAGPQASARKAVWMWGVAAAALVLALGVVAMLFSGDSSRRQTGAQTATAQAEALAEAQVAMESTAEAAQAAMQATSATATAQAVAAFEEEPDFTRSMAAETQADEPFADDFEANTAGWPITQSPVSRQLVDGAYQILVTEPDRAVSTVPDRLKTYDKFRYALDAVLVDGQPESGYGLVFHRRNGENYYVFAVNGLRQWSVWRLADGAWQELRNLPGGEQWTPSEAVLPPGESNRLQIEVNHDTFTLFVNDQMLHQLSDPNVPVGGGLVGMYVASSRTANGPLAQVRFDDLVLEPLAETETPSMTAKPQ